MKKIIILVLLLGVLISGCTHEEEKYTGPIEKVTLGVESSLLPAAVWIAENNGYFEEQGLDVTIKECALL